MYKWHKYGISIYTYLWDSIQILRSDNYTPSPGKRKRGHKQDICTNGGSNLQPHSDNGNSSFSQCCFLTRLPSGHAIPLVCAPRVVNAQTVWGVRKHPLKECVCSSIYIIAFIPNNAHPGSIESRSYTPPRPPSTAFHLPLWKIESPWKIGGFIPPYKIVTVSLFARPSPVSSPSSIAFAYFHSTSVPRYQCWCPTIPLAVS